MDAKEFPLIVVLSVTSQHGFVALKDVVALASHIQGRQVKLDELPRLSNQLRLKLLKKFPRVSHPHVYMTIRKIEVSDNAERTETLTNDLIVWLSSHLELENVGLIPIKPDPDNVLEKKEVVITT